MWCWCWWWGQFELKTKMREVAPWWALSGFWILDFWIFRGAWIMDGWMSWVDCGHVITGGRGLGT
jgi:hypothetical protein